MTGSANPASPDEAEIEAAQPQIIHISNLDEGGREIVVLPSS